jgi:hypothetical protein
MLCHQEKEMVQDILRTSLLGSFGLLFFFNEPALAVHVSIDIDENTSW